jgi:hypothetical protein
MPGRAVAVAAGLAIAALLVVCFITPFASRSADRVACARRWQSDRRCPLRRVGELFPNWLRRLADIPGYWLIILPIELPAAYFAGLVGLMAALRSTLPPVEKLAVAALACLAGTGLVISWLLASTFSGNNDLGLRAIIPAEIILIVSAATMLTMTPRRVGITVMALAGLALSCRTLRKSSATISQASQSRTAESSRKHPNSGRQCVNTQRPAPAWPTIRSISKT